MACRERVEVAVRREHDQFDVDQRAHVLAECAQAVCELVGHQAVGEAIDGRQRAVQPVKLLVILVERSQRGLLNAFDFERSHHGFDCSGDRVKRSIRFGHQNTDQVAPARVATSAIGDASRRILDRA
eukprot:6003299-Pleurochrysis_carterae.AAC.1